MSDEPGKVGGRFVEVSLALLLGAMALSGAVTILRAIWLYLCVLAAVVALLALVGWLIYRRIGRW